MYWKFRKKISLFRDENTQFDEENKRFTEKLLTENDGELNKIKRILQMQQQVWIKDRLMTVTKLIWPARDICID